jgi:hypothetical protein
MGDLGSVCISLKDLRKSTSGEGMRWHIATRLGSGAFAERSFEPVLASLGGAQATDVALRAYLDGIHDRHARFGRNPFARSRARTEWRHASRALVNALRQADPLRGLELQRLVSLLVDASSPLDARETRTVVEEMARHVSVQPRQTGEPKSDFLELARHYLAIYRQRPAEWTSALRVLHSLGLKARLATAHMLDQWVEHAELECLWTRDGAGPGEA